MAHAAAELAKLTSLHPHMRSEDTKLFALTVVPAIDLDPVMQWNGGGGRSMISGGC